MATRRLLWNRILLSNQIIYELGKHHIAYENERYDKKTGK